MIIVKTLIKMPMLKITPVVKKVIKKIKIEVMPPKIKPIKSPFFLRVLVVINVAKKRLIAPKIVDTCEIMLGEIFEYKTIMLNNENKIAKITNAIKSPKTVVLKMFFNFNLFKIISPLLCNFKFIF